VSYGLPLGGDETDWEIYDRFKRERHPEKTVDGDDPYDYDPYGEDDGE
jgi:hypothetical protein